MSRPSMIALLCSLVNLYCMWGRRVVRPIPTLFYRGAGPRGTLLVLLPGRGDGVEDFEKKGFIDDLRREGIDWDVVAVDAHLVYYVEQEIVDRLRDDVLAPARARGYRRIVVVGISLGALGGLATAMDHPELVDELLLISPYLGPVAVQREIERFGGLSTWRAPPGHEPEDFQRFARDLWGWIRDLPARAEGPRLWVAHGDSEGRLMRGFRLLDEVRPESTLLVDSGRHTWRLWRGLWKRMLAERWGPFAAD